MNLPLFIARRLSLSKGNSSSSRVMVRIAIISIAISITVILVAWGVVGGFKQMLTQKISAIAGDAKLTIRSVNNPSMIVPFVMDSSLLNSINRIKGIKKVEGYATAQGLLQASEAVETVLLHGVENDYDWSFLKNHLVAGVIPVYNDSTRSREVVISTVISKKLGLGVGDIFKLIVINEDPRRDRFRVAAIYDSGLSEFDSKMLFGDIATVRRVNGWDENAVEGFQIFTGRDENVTDEVYDLLPATGRWNVSAMRDDYVQFFDWIKMLEFNATFVLIIMLIVAVINMLCGVLVIVLESIGMIGVLKTQGITSGGLQKIFMYRSAYIILMGLFWGNLIGLGVCALQYFFEIVKLDADAYILSTTPMWLSWKDVLVLNLGSFVVILVLMIIPTIVVNRINPAESVKYG